MITNFDPTKPPPKVWESNLHHLILNIHSASLLQMLKWPKAMLLIFGTEREALVCLKTLFPHPELVEAENMRIRVQIKPLADIDWNFQSSFDGFRSFPARPLEVIHNLNSSRLYVQLV